MPRRRKVFQKGFRKSYSLSRMIIEQLALHWVTERSFLSKTAVNFYREDEDEEIPAKIRLNALQQVSNILNNLKRKDLIYIVPRKLIVNVPRLLYLYQIKLPPNVKRDVREAQKADKYMEALHSAAAAFHENLGVNFPISRAYEITRGIVAQYYEKFHGYLVTLDEFTDKSSKIIIRINQANTNGYFSNRVVEIVTKYLLDIVAMTSYNELIAELMELIREVAGYKLVEEIGERWRALSSKIQALTNDPDFRTASYARQFLQTSVNADIVTSVSLF